ncbi:MAG: hypothetical protein HC853_03045 [Anaerolineae bacterium]|nr:hypothetical protein [Anaerolineae bacterium]
MDELGNKGIKPSHLDQFIAEIEVLQHELNAYIKEHLLDPYDALLHRAIDGFVEVAREAWTAIKKEVPEWLVTIEEFEEQARVTIMKRFPTAERVRDDIRIEVRLSEIFHSAELMRLKRTEEQERAGLQQAQAERETAQRVTVEAMRDRQIAEMETERQVAVIKAKTQAEQDAAYEAEMEQKRHWAMLQLAQQLSAEDSPLMDILQHVREFTERFANQAIGAIEKKGVLDNGMQRRIREYILDFRSWDVSSEAGDDQALKTIVAELEGNLAAAEIQGLLQTLKHLKNVAATPGQILVGMETRLAMTKPKTWRTICRACKKFGHAHTYEPPTSCPHCGVGEGEMTAYEVQA